VARASLVGLDGDRAGPRPPRGRGVTAAPVARLSLTFARAARPPEELRRAAGAAAIRRAGGPLALLATAALLGADVPGVFYLLAGMPSAFHLLVLARVYEVRPALMNRIVFGTTIPAVVAVILVTGLAR
jgi:predicted permease